MLPVADAAEVNMQDMDDYPGLACSYHYCSVLDGWCGHNPLESLA